jgi:DNA-binding NarL/FixJ family response regulator
MTLTNPVTPTTGNQSAYRVAVVDDHDAVGLAVSALIENLLDLEFVGSANTVSGLLEASSSPDLVVLDLRLNDGSSPVVNVARLHESGTQVLAYTSAEHTFLLRMAARAGVQGLVRKSAPTSDLVDALLGASRGEIAASADWAAAIDGDPELAAAHLSPQEKRVLERYASGMAAKSVAYDLGITEHTVEDYLKRIRSQYAVMGRRSPTKVDLYKRALEDGYLPLPTTMKAARGR